MREEKKKVLSRYLLQEAKINRLREMCRINPQSKDIYEKRIKEAQKLRIDIEEKINAVDDPLLCEVLHLKYICGKTLEEIGLILNYSKRHIERLHIKALDRFKF